MTVSVLRPRKSIFNRPSRSSVPMGYWVVMTSSLSCNGTYSVTGLAVMSTPAACVLAWRGMPSRVSDVSSSRRTCGSLSESCRSWGLISIALVSVMSSAKGMALATWSTEA